MRMLDLGVGGGRTTIYFGGLVKEYIGVDYSEQMISACKTRFSQAQANISFKVSDVRNMRDFTSGYFDFILFSFNGIDYVNHQDRIQALREIKRVGKAGAHFCFSSHNLLAINSLFRLHNIFSYNPKRLITNTVKLIRLRLRNNPKEMIESAKKAAYLIFNDGALNFGLDTYYIKPIEQVAQLRAEGFYDIGVFSLNTGNRIDKDDLDNMVDSWLYYSCRIP